MISVNNFRNHIRELRAEKNVTQSQLGEAVGLSKQSINDIEHGRRLTTMNKLRLIADYFSVSVDYLVGTTDDPNRSLETVHTIPKKPFIIQDALGVSHKTYPHDFSVVVSGDIPYEALEELQSFVSGLKKKYKIYDD